MEFLSKGTKGDLQILAYELGEDVSPELEISELKRVIVECKEYNDEDAENMLDIIIEERLEREERERKGKERERRMAKLDKEIEEMKKQREIALDVLRIKMGITRAQPRIEEETIVVENIVESSVGNEDLHPRIMDHSPNSETKRSEKVVQDLNPTVPLIRSKEVELEKLNFGSENIRENLVKEISSTEDLTPCTQAICDQKVQKSENKEQEMMLEKLSPPDYKLSEKEGIMSRNRSPYLSKSSSGEIQAESLEELKELSTLIECRGVLIGVYGNAINLQLEVRFFILEKEPNEKNSIVGNVLKIEVDSLSTREKDWEKTRLGFMDDPLVRVSLGVEVINEFTIVRRRTKGDLAAERRERKLRGNHRGPIVETGTMLKVISDSEENLERAFSCRNREKKGESDVLSFSVPADKFVCKQTKSIGRISFVMALFRNVEVDLLFRLFYHNSRD